MTETQQLDMARGHATMSIPVCRAEQSVGEIREELSDCRFDYAGDVAVLTDNVLVGLVSIERVLAADENVLVTDVMEPAPPVVGPEADQEAVAMEMVRRGESSVAVVDSAGDFLGLVPPHRMLRVLLAEHDEDLARLGGYLARTERARSAAEETVLRRLWHRLPWLFVGLGGAMAAAIIVGRFEEQLDKKVLLAFFLPAVVYMADAVGTQTETVLIRGLAVGVELRDVVLRELATGLVVGALMAAAFFPFALVVWGDGRVAVAVGLSLAASCSIATLVAMVFPWVFWRLGADPAFGSGPLATVVQDLLSITVYLLIATEIVG